MEPGIGKYLLEPFYAHENAMARAEDVLDRIIHHGHQWDDGAERHDDENRQDEKPGFVVFPFVVHKFYPSCFTGSAGSVS